MGRILAMILGSIFLPSAIIYAEIISLESGERIEGRVVGRSDKVVMIRFKDGRYKTYSAQEVRSIKDDGGASSAETASSGRQKGVYRLRSGSITVEISLPDEWKRAEFSGVPGSQLEALGAFVIGGGMKTAPAILFVEKSRDQAFGAYATADSQKQYFEEFLERLKSSGLALYGASVSDEYKEFLGPHCLILVYTDPEGRYTKEIYFIRAASLYKIALAVSDKALYYKEWPAIEKSIRSIKFLEE